MRVKRLETVTCPIDGLPLREASMTLVCGNGHSFDRARDGYVNLLVVQHKASRDPGDTKAMVAARRRTLETAIFAPIAECVFEIIRNAASRRTRFRILDAGCGDGYYLEQITHHAVGCADGVELSLAGTDVSKWAIQAAAKRAAPVTWLVANNRHLPFAAGALDLILVMFGFPIWQGFTPVLAPLGRVVLVDPGPDHLIEVRRLIYPEVKEGPAPELDVAGYSVESQQSVRYATAMPTQAAIHDLVAMTPHAFRMSDAGRSALSTVKQLTVTVDVSLRVVVRSE